MVTSFGCSDGDAEDRESAVEHGFSALLNMQGAGDEALAVLERLEGGMEGVLGTVLRLMGAQRRAEAVQVFGLSMLNTFTARKGGEGDCMLPRMQRGANDRPKASATCNMAAGGIHRATCNAGVPATYTVQRATRGVSRQFFDEICIKT